MMNQNLNPRHEVPCSRHKSESLELESHKFTSPELLSNFSAGEVISIYKKFQYLKSTTGIESNELLASGLLVFAIAASRYAPRNIIPEGFESSQHSLVKMDCPIFLKTFSDQKNQSIYEKLIHFISNSPYLNAVLAEFNTTEAIQDYKYGARYGVKIIDKKKSISDEDIVSTIQILQNDYPSLAVRNLLFGTFCNARNTVNANAVLWDVYKQVSTELQPRVKAFLYSRLLINQIKDELFDALTSRVAQICKIEEGRLAGMEIKLAGSCENSFQEYVLKSLNVPRILGLTAWLTRALSESMNACNSLFAASETKAAEETIFGSLIFLRRSKLAGYNLNHSASEIVKAVVKPALQALEDNDFYKAHKIFIALAVSTPEVIPSRVLAKVGVFDTLQEANIQRLVRFATGITSPIREHTWLNRLAAGEIREIRKDLNLEFQRLWNNPHEIDSTNEYKISSLDLNKALTDIYAEASSLLNQAGSTQKVVELQRDLRIAEEENAIKVAQDQIADFHGQCYSRKIYGLVKFEYLNGKLTSHYLSETTKGVKHHTGIVRRPDLILEGIKSKGYCKIDEIEYDTLAARQKLEFANRYSHNDKLDQALSLMTKWELTGSEFIKPLKAVCSNSKLSPESVGLARQLLELIEKIVS